MGPELSPPVLFTPEWLWIVFPLVGVCALFLVLVFVMTRKLRKAHNVEGFDPLLSSSERLSVVKNLYAAEIAKIGEQYREGSVSERKAYQSLSVLLRNFTHEYSRTSDNTATLRELEGRDAPALLVDRIRELYPGAFSDKGSEGTVQSAVDEALKVVQVWH